jgi:predicted RNA methylase
MDLLIGDMNGLSLNLDAVKTLSFHEQYNYFNRFVEHDVLATKTKSITKDEKLAFSKANEKLDKYYTKQCVANQCYLAIKELLRVAGKKNKDLLFIEPSAGSGVFLNAIQESKLGFDIAPTKESNHPIQQNDFLNDDLFELLDHKELAKQLIFIGNPPFGTKSKLAIEFVNKSLGYSNIVGFIVPVQFRKWSVQSKINPNARLILDMDLQENAFEFMGKDYKVRCCFQVWALDTFSTKFKDLRIAVKPDTDHPDFEMYQYNRTEQAKKFFDYEWDFAVPRQGYLDYSTKAVSKNDCDIKQQWIFFKAKNKKTLERLKKLDFDKLSKKNIGIPGFGKADVVQEYLAMFG